jgi:hypothetical protein
MAGQKYGYLIHVKERELKMNALSRRNAGIRPRSPDIRRMPLPAYLTPTNGDDKC